MDALSLKALPPVVRPALRAVRNWRELAQTVGYRAVPLAKACGVSPRSLRRFFHEDLKTSLRVWLKRQRIYFAKKELKALAAGGGQIKEIALVNAAYTRSQNFSRQFKRTCGVSPSEWILSHQPSPM